jgi:hypothetical protein
MEYIVGATSKPLVSAVDGREEAVESGATSRLKRRR